MGLVPMEGSEAIEGRCSFMDPCTNSVTLTDRMRPWIAIRFRILCGVVPCKFLFVVWGGASLSDCIRNHIESRLKAAMGKYLLYMCWCGCAGSPMCAACSPRSAWASSRILGRYLPFLWTTRRCSAPLSTNSQVDSSMRGCKILVFLIVYFGFERSFAFQCVDMSVGR